MKKLAATGGTHVPSRSSDNRLHASSSSLDLASTDNEQVLWVKCRGCEELVFKKMLVRNLYTCPRCQYNNPMPNDQRIRQTLDSVEYMSTDDPDFSQIWPTKLLEYHHAVVGLGQIGNGNVVILAGIPTNLTLPLRAIELAIDQQSPLVTFIPADYNPAESSASQSLDMSPPRLEGDSAQSRIGVASATTPITSLSAIDLTCLAVKLKGLGQQMHMTILTSMVPAPVNTATDLTTEETKSLDSWLARSPERQPEQVGDGQLVSELVHQCCQTNFPLGDIVLLEQTIEKPTTQSSPNGFIDRVSSRQSLPQLLIQFIAWSDRTGRS